MDTLRSFNTPAWGEDLSSVSFPKFEGDTETDVCVVGLGGSGLSCIHELLRLGQRVVGLDANSVGGGAAGRNGGFLLAGLSAFYHDAVAALGDARARRIYQLTLDEMDRIAEDAPQTVRRCGSLRLASSDAEEGDCALQLAAMRADGLAVTPYAGPDGRGLLFPADGSFNPLARCRTLAQRAVELGATLHEQSRAVSLGNGEVRTSDGRVRCKHVIVAVDGHLELLLPELAGRVRTARLQMLGTDPAPDVDIPRPVYSRWGYDYWQQLQDGRIVIGGCRDRFVEDEWTTDTDPTSEVQQCIERVLRDTVGVTQQVRHRWAAAVSYSSGILPVMEQVRQGVWAIGGYSGTGNVIGALYGRMVAQIAVTGQSDLLSALAPNA
ncbi:MAG: FAD-binding oxidoreductase [Gemmatimonadota bacterium]